VFHKPGAHISLVSREMRESANLSAEYRSSKEGFGTKFQEAAEKVDE
jgi:hypothetical protein